VVRRSAGPRCNVDDCPAFAGCVLGGPGGEQPWRSTWLVKLRILAGLDVFHQGAPQAGAVVLCRGVARLYARVAEGKQVLLRLSQPGELLAMPTPLPHAYSCRAETESWVATVDRAAIRALVRRDALLGSAILGIMAAQNAYYVQRIVALASQGARGRLADALYGLLTDPRSGVPQTLPVQLSAKDLGEMAGCSRQTASSWLYKLQRTGVIARGDGAIRVLRPDLLSAMSQR